MGKGIRSSRPPILGLEDGFRLVGEQGWGSYW